MHNAPLLRIQVEVLKDVIAFYAEEVNHSAHSPVPGSKGEELQKDSSHMNQRNNGLYYNSSISVCIEDSP